MDKYAVAKAVAGVIINQDMGAKKRAAFIEKCWNGGDYAFFNDNFTEYLDMIGEAEADAMEVEQ